MSGYRLYIDESGDHVFKNMDHHRHRYLCLLGCFFSKSDYVDFNNAVCRIKSTHFKIEADDPVIFHREDIINKRGYFSVFQNKEQCLAFDNDLIKTVNESKFKTFAIVIDKLALVRKYSSPAHPYHLAMEFVLQRYCGFLQSVGATGDVLAESRGGKEDLLLKNAYRSVYETGRWKQGSKFFQSTLSSHDLKVKQKIQNISGLQLCDLLGNPVKHHVLLRHSRVEQPLSDFDKRIIGTLPGKYHVHVYDGKIQDSGHVLWPLK